MSTTLHNLKQKIKRFERYAKTEIEEMNRLITKLEAEAEPGHQRKLILDKSDGVGEWLSNYNIHSMREFERWMSKVDDPKDILDLYKEETGYKYTLKQLRQAVTEYYQTPNLQVIQDV